MVVTGCSSGLGRTIAFRLGEAGWRVFATARTDADLKSLVDAGLQAVRLDLASSEMVGRAASEILEKTEGRIDALVNNAAVGQLEAVEDLTRGEMRELFETNVFGTIELTNLFFPAFRRQRRGRIVFISSVCGRVSLPYFGNYSASKFALEALVDALRRETRETGVGIQLIEPGMFQSRMFERSKSSFERKAASRAMVHAERCSKRLALMEQEHSGIPEGRSVLIADAAIAFLQGKNDAARKIVPHSAAVYELARRFLPDKLLDRLVEARRG